MEGSYFEKWHAALTTLLSSARFVEKVKVPRKQRFETDYHPDTFFTTSLFKLCYLNIAVTKKTRSDANKNDEKHYPAVCGVH